MTARSEQRNLVVHHMTSSSEEENARSGQRNMRNLVMHHMTANSEQGTARSGHSESDASYEFKLRTKEPDAQEHKAKQGTAVFIVYILM